MQWFVNQCDRLHPNRLSAENTRRLDAFGRNIKQIHDFTEPWFHFLPPLSPGGTIGDLKSNMVKKTELQGSMDRFKRNGLSINMTNYTWTGCLFILNNHDVSDYEDLNMLYCLGFMLTFTDFTFWNNRLTENSARLDKLSQKGAYCGYQWDCFDIWSLNICVRTIGPTDINNQTKKRKHQQYLNSRHCSCQ